LNDKSKQQQQHLQTQQQEARQRKMVVVSGPSSSSASSSSSLRRRRGVVDRLARRIRRISSYLLFQNEGGGVGGSTVIMTKNRYSWIVGGMGLLIGFYVVIGGIFLLLHPNAAERTVSTLRPIVSMRVLGPQQPPPQQQDDESSLTSGSGSDSTSGADENQNNYLPAPSILACQTTECRTRLHQLETKILLEEEIYQDMYEEERKRTLEYPKIVFNRTEIIQQRFGEIHKNAQQAMMKHRNNQKKDSSATDTTTTTTTTMKRFSANREWWHKSHPEICIVGNLKTGSSQLYNIFATHRDVQKIPTDKKEHCAFDHRMDEDDKNVGDGSQTTMEYGLHEWHKYYYHRYDEVHHKPRVNGCVAWKQVEFEYAYSPPNPETTKFFVLLRDPAEWAWAAYNFWLDEGWEGKLYVVVD